VEERAHGMDKSVSPGTLRDSCKCEALALLRHIHLDSFFLDPEDVREPSIGAIWCFGKGTGLL
jgi:hypothetical protein